MGLTLDTGALIAFERQDRRLMAHLKEAEWRGQPLTVPTVVVAEADLASDYCRIKIAVRLHERKWLAGSALALEVEARPDQSPRSKRLHHAKRSWLDLAVDPLSSDACPLPSRHRGDG